MGRYLCVKCSSVLWDPDIYNRAVQTERRKATWKTLIKCPSCGHIQTLGEMRDKIILETDDNKLGPRGLRLKKKLQKKLSQLKDESITKLSAKEILAMLRVPSGHPNQHGYPYSRSKVLEECKKRGKQLLEELGWPTSSDAIYYNIRDGEPETLKDITDDWQLDGFRGMLHEQEEELNRLTNGEFYGDCASKGLECSTVSEWKILVEKHPTIQKKIREAIRLHKGFWEILYKKSLASLNDSARRADESADNIIKLSNWVGLDVNKTEEPDSLPKLSIYYGVWAVLEHYSPTRPKIEEVIKHIRGQASMDVFVR